MRRILFVAEAVTLAQVVRLVALGRALDPARHELHFASAAFDERVFAGTPFRRHPLRSLTPRQVERAVAWGTRIYGRRVLGRYLDDDLRLLDEVEPDLVVGDLRWSLLVSAPLRRVPHAALVNAYWSPDALLPRFPLPDHPVVKLLGPALAGEHFERALPLVFRHFARPLDALRRRYGLPPLGELRALLVAGDLTLFPDAPGLVPTRALPPTHHFLGPVLWSPDAPAPAAWDRLDPARPTVYVTLGSSGRVAALAGIVAAIARLSVNVIVATAGRAALGPQPAHVAVSDLVPGAEAVRRAAVVVCNGGSSTGYQALHEGRPVVGLPWNLDQYLAMTCIEAAGAGRLLRGGSARPGEVAAAVEAALGGAHAAGADRAREALRALDSGERFRGVVEGVFSKREHIPAPPAGALVAAPPGRP